MPNVIFVRHAKTILNKEGKFAGRNDCNVTSEGLEVARESFQFSADDFDYVYCSPLKRTSQTLDAIMPDHAEPIIDERIIERYFGDWEDMPYSNVSDELIEKYVKGLYDPPNSEPYVAVQQRVLEFVEEMFQKYKPEDRILVISHAGVVRQIRDNFLPRMQKERIKNSTALTVTNEDFEEYLKRKAEREDEELDK